jgi:RNA polymerase sigma-70 factor (sigma-E family)
MRRGSCGGDHAAGIVRRGSCGDEEAEVDEREFESFVVARTPALLRTAYLLCGDQHLAEDLVQLSLARTAARLPKIREVAALEAYVRRAMYHEQVNRWRRRRVPEDLGPVNDIGGARHNMSRAVETDSAEARLMVRDALLAIGPRQRAVLVLRFFEDLTERETAAALGCSIGTVKSQTRKALQRLVERCPDLADLAPIRREARP